jgi:two-component system, chemotaxis family, chemotaxis protein CheY
VTPAGDVPERARILVVAHSSRARNAARASLEKAGHLVGEASDGREALAALEDPTGHLDLVITDVYLPGLDGLSLVRRARRLSRYRSIPILVLTAECSEDMKRRGEVAGATDWLVQPLASGELTRIVARALGTSRAMTFDCVGSTVDGSVRHVIEHAGVPHDVVSRTTGYPRTSTRAAGVSPIDAATAG